MEQNWGIITSSINSSEDRCNKNLKNCSMIVSTSCSNLAKKIEKINHSNSLAFSTFMQWMGKLQRNSHILFLVRLVLISMDIKYEKLKLTFVRMQKTAVVRGLSLLFDGSFSSNCKVIIADLSFYQRDQKVKRLDMFIKGTIDSW